VLVAPLLLRLGIEKVVVVTSAFHVPRCELLALCCRALYVSDGSDKWFAF
jgi:hypothetical protein